MQVYMWFPREGQIAETGLSGALVSKRQQSPRRLSWHSVAKSRPGCLAACGWGSTQGRPCDTVRAHKLGEMMGLTSLHAFRWDWLPGRLGNIYVGEHSAQNVDTWISWHSVMLCGCHLAGAFLCLPGSQYQLCGDCLRANFGSGSHMSLWKWKGEHELAWN